MKQHGVKDIKVINGATRIGDVKRNYSDTTKAKQRLNWQPKVSQEEGLIRTVEYFIK
jgi:UDP-glucose 4-epimerase